jgi:hypothetical protein
MSESVTLLDKDSRLKINFDREFRPYSARTFCIDAKQKLKIPFSVEMNELQSLEFELGCKDKSIVSVMDAIASLHEFRWKVKKNGYELIHSLNLYSIYSGKNDPGVNKRNEIGMQLVDQMSNISPALRSSIFSRGGISIDRLPDSMALKVRALLKTKEEDRQKANPNYQERLGSISDKKITISMNEKEGISDFNAFEFTYSGEGFGGGTFMFTDYDKQISDNSIGGVKNPNNGIYIAQKNSVSKQKQTTHPTMKQFVDIQANRITMVEISKLLFDKYDISVFCSPKRIFKQSRPVSISRMPMHKALDQLCRLYDAEWDWRKYDFLVINKKFPLAGQ